MSLHPELVFGWRTALLALASLQMLALAAALLQGAGQRVQNRTANRLLAAFLIVLTGVVAPYTIGFAGFYDAWPWLSFAPLALSLLLAPLLYGYVHALVTGRRPGRWRLHLAPGLAQLAYGLVCFSLPLAAKDRWNAAVHAPIVDPIVSLGVLIGLAAYAVAGLRLLRRYRLRLADQRGDDDRFAAPWLRSVLVALIVTLAVWSGFQAWEWIAGGIDYFQSLGLYLWLSALGLYLAVERWRHAALAFPPLDAAPPDPAADAAPAPRTPEKDWSALAADYAAVVRREAWWREPDLTLAQLSRRLGTNTGQLSRAINLGLGVNFSTFLNGLRAEAVAQALDRGPANDLLALAFDCGFSSKASFNRAFQARHGVTPSAWRRRARDVSDRDYATPDPKLRRAEA